MSRDSWVKIPHPHVQSNQKSFIHTIHHLYPRTCTPCNDSFPQEIVRMWIDCLLKTFQPWTSFTPVRKKVCGRIKTPEQQFDHVDNLLFPTFTHVIRLPIPGNPHQLI